MLAITGLPAAGNQLAVPISLATNGLGPNTLQISVVDEVIGGTTFAVATITANTTGGPVTNRYWNFGNLIQFTGTFDTAGTVTNAVTIESPYGIDLTADGAAATKWYSALDFTPAGVTDVQVKLQWADSLALTTTPGQPAGSGPSSITGIFTSPTLAGGGAEIKISSNATLSVLPGGVKTYDLDLIGTKNGSISSIDLQGPIDVTNDLEIVDANDITIDELVTAGGTVTIRTAGGTAPAGSIVIDRAITAGGAITIDAAQNLTTKAVLTSTLGGITLTAGDELAVDDDLDAFVAVGLSGVAGIALDASSDVLARTGAVTLTSVSGAITSAGTLTATASTVAITSDLSAAVAAVTARNGITVDAGIDALIDGPFTVTGQGAIGIDGGNNVVIGGAVAIQGTGNLTATAAGGDLDVLPDSPLTVVDGTIALEAAAGTVAIEAQVLANLAITVKAEQGLFLSNLVDTAAEVRATGPAGSVTLTNNANLLFIDAPVTSQADDVTITCTLDDIEIRDDLSALFALKITGNTPVEVNGVAPASITLTAETQGIAITSTLADVVVGPNATFVAGPGATSGISLTAGTVVDLQIPLTAEADIEIVSPDLFTVLQPLTSNLGAITITSSDGPVASVLAPLNASKAITITAKDFVSVDNTLTSTSAGISLESTGGFVTIAPTCNLVAADVVDGAIAITAAGVFTMGNHLTAGSDITVTTGAAFAPVKDFTSATGDISITATVGGLTMTGSTITAPGGSAFLSAKTGAVALGPMALDPVFGNLTVISGLPFTPPPLPLVIGGNLTFESGGSFLPAPGSCTSLNGSISLTFHGSIDVTGYGLTALNGGITLSSDTGNVTVATDPFLVDPFTAAGVVNLLAPAGQVTLGQPVVAGGAITIDSFGGFTMPAISSIGGKVAITSGGGSIAGAGPLSASDDVSLVALGAVTLPSVTSTAGMIEVTSTTGSIGGAGPLSASAAIDLTAAGVIDLPLSTSLTGGIRAQSIGNDIAVVSDLTALAGTIELNAFGEVRGATSLAPITAQILALTLDVVAQDGFGVGAALAFTNVANDVVEATFELAAGAPVGTGVSYVDANTFTVNSVITATGPVELESIAGGITVLGGIGASFGETLTAVTLEAVDSISIDGTVRAAAGAIDILSTLGSVAVQGSLESSPIDTIEVTAGDSILITGNITGGVGILLAAGNLIDLGVAGGTAVISTVTGDIVATATGDITMIGADVSAPVGAISITTPAQLAFDGGLLEAWLTYASTPLPIVGLITLQGLGGINVSTSPLVRCGRLEIIGGGGGPITLDDPLNDVDTLQVEAGGNFTYYQELTPLAIDDPDDLLNRTVQVRSTGGSISITSLAGLRIVDGLEYNTTLELVGRDAGADPGVEFVVTSAGDNPSPPFLPHPFAFDGTLRDMIGYVNDNIAVNAAGTGNTPMRVVFDDARSPAVVALDDTLPEIVKAITFDGIRLGGGRVGIDGTGIASPTANGLSFGTGSAGSVAENAYIYGFGNAGIQATSGRNVFRALTIGANPADEPAGNGIGILLTGPLAVQNVVGIQVAGDVGNDIVNNGTGLVIFDRASFTTVQGNFIAGNDDDGIAVTSSLGTLVGSAASALLTNTIAGNGRHGVSLENVQGSSIAYGATIQGNAITSNGGSGVQIIGGGRNLVGGLILAAGNRIEGNADGVRMVSSILPTPTNNNHVLGNTVIDNERYGVHSHLGFANLVSGNTVSGNGDTGVRITGTVATRARPSNVVVNNVISGNGGNENNGGIVVHNSSGQRIGMDLTGAILGNTLVDNDGSGIVITGTTANKLNQVVGNTVSGSEFDGVRVVGVAASTVRSNIASGNAAAGISVVDSLATSTSGNIVQANIASGNAVGIRVAGSRFTLVGGTLVADGNYAHSNTSDGIRVNGSTNYSASEGTVVRNNVVGVAPGDVPAGNGGYGVSIVNATRTVVDYSNVVASNTSGGIRVRGGTSNTIGSGAVGRGNKVARNTGSGIVVQEAGAVSQQQVVVTVAGNLVEENGGDGIFVEGARAQAVTIGRAPSIARPNGTANTIRDNVGAGIRVDAATNVTMIGNTIYDNGADPIVLQNGANAGVLAPTPGTAVIARGNAGAPQWDITGTVAGATNQRFYVDLYMDVTTGGQFYMGRVLVSGGRPFRVLLRGPANGIGSSGIRATATLANGGLSGSTSVYSASWPA